MIEKKFNLIDENWIPVADKGYASLRQVFVDGSITALGGDPVQKISVMKLLLAIAQSAWTPADETEWSKVGVTGMRDRVSIYLDKWHDAFWLYGDKPFLQMPEIEKAEKKTVYKIGNGSFPDLYQDNNTILTQYDKRDISTNDSLKALFLVTVQSFAFAGKQVDPNIILTSTEGFKKSSVAKVGPSLGRICYLHAFAFYDNLITTIYLNILTLEGIKKIGLWENVLGIAFWEKMPANEECINGSNAKHTLLGALVPLSRFLLFTEVGLYYSEGLMYPKFQDGWIEPSFIWSGEKEGKILTAKVDEKPWMNLTSILSFLGSIAVFNCISLQTVLSRISCKPNAVFSIWTGGLSVNGDAFGQKIKEKDGFVSSEIQLSTEVFHNASVFLANLQEEMNNMKDTEITLKRCVYQYFKYLTDSKNNTKKRNKTFENLSGAAAEIYWQLCERSFQKLVDACASDSSGATAQLFRKKYLENAYTTYDRFCPNQTARQMEAWAANRFGFDKKTTEEKKEAVK